LLPGQSLLLKDGTTKTISFWDLPVVSEANLRRDGKRVIEEFHHLFRDAVRIRMRSDVAYGAFLSAGIDSAAVVATMAQESTSSVITCTVGFPPPTVDERHGARMIAERFNTSHIEREVATEDAAFTIEKLAWHYDEPFGDTSSLPTYLISKVAREYVKMVLTGDGGDEVFAGYTIFQGEKLAAHMQLLPKGIRDLVPGLLAFGAGAMPAGRTYSTPARILQTLQAAALSFPDRLLNKQVGIPQDLRCKLLTGIPGVRPVVDMLHELLSPVADAPPLMQLQYWLTRYSLADDMLCKVDRATMAAGLEARAPFLDYRIVELLASTHWSTKMPLYSRKHLLKTAMRGILPETTLRGKKRGFNIPQGVLLKNGAGDFLRQRARVCGGLGLLNQVQLDQYLTNAHESGMREDSHIWMLAMLSYCG
jgi:asparagine synthase (glutamine-hydrolysing)